MHFRMPMAFCFAVFFAALNASAADGNIESIFMDYWWLILIIPLTFGLKKLMDKMDQH